MLKWTTVETVVLLGRKDVEYAYIDYEPSPENMLKGSASYREIREWVQAEYGVSVSSLYVAQVKRKHGLIERECYNKGSEDHRVPVCPPEKEAMIEAALRHFRML